MAKLVDAPASGAGDRKVVGVRVPSWAPNTSKLLHILLNGGDSRLFKPALEPHGSMKDLGLHLIP